MTEGTIPPHVLLFPLPLQGPVNCMIKLGELLWLAGFHITLVATEYTHRRLLAHTDIQTRLHHYPGFHLVSLPDGLPENHPRSVNQLIDLFHSLDTVTRPLFKQLLTSGRLRSCDPLCRRRPVSCIIADGTLSFTCDVANEVGIPIIYIRTISACCLWIFFCLPRLIQSEEFPFKGNDLNAPIKSVPSMEGFLRRRDLPGFCRSSNPNDPKIQSYMSESQETPRAYGVILNSFEDLEGPALSHIRTLCPNLYNIGPLHAQLRTKLESESTASMKTSSNSLLEEDRSCMMWLDDQPLKSVVYVSFGSLAVITKDQLMEFWNGLVNSGKRFLWVIRPGSTAEKDWESHILADLKEGTKERGRIVDWAPQEEVLAHPAVALFWTHGGWNSILESVYEGVPMICWPFFLDQQINSRFVGEVWKVGLDMKDTCDRVIIDKMIKDVMEVRRDQFEKSARETAQVTRKCLSEGGSSYCDLERLIKDIKLLSDDRVCSN